MSRNSERLKTEGTIERPSFPDDERPLQQRRRGWLILFFLIMFLTSIGTEIHNRALDTEDLSDNWIEASRAVVDPDAPPPTIDPLGNVLAVGAVVRNMLPPVLMLSLAVWLVARFMQAVHGMSSLAEARVFLWTNLFGRLVVGRWPTIIVSEGKVVGGEQQPPVRIGGPASIVVQNDSAVLLEQAGRLTRVIGPGSSHVLQRFEKVRSVVDLRPRWHSLEVSGMSREGIPVRCTVDVHYQINDRGEDAHAATREKPHAFSEEAVFKAAIAPGMPEFDSADRVEWGDLVAGGASGTLRAIVARYPLDRLVQPLTEVSGPEATLGDITPPPRQTIQRELEAELRKNAAAHGGKILEVTLRNIELEDPVTNQWIEAWGAMWEKRRREELALASAEWERQMARVKAEAEKEMILAILDALETLEEDGKTVSQDLIAMRFLKTLQNIYADTRSIPVLPYTNQVLDTLELLRAMVEEESEEPGDNRAITDGDIPQSNDGESNSEDR